MSEENRESSDQIARAAASWLCVLGGVTLCAIVAMVPPWLELQRTQVQRDVLQQQAEHYEAQKKAYQTLAGALDEADPAAVEFMAYHQLGLKPVGSRSMGRYALAGVGPALRPYTTPGMSVEDWLAKPPPRLNPAALTPPFARTRIARLATGPTRLALVALAGVSIALGIIMAAPKTSE